MSTRSKIRGVLSVVIICLSTVIFAFFCMESNAMAKPASTAEVENSREQESEQDISSAQPTAEPQLTWSLLLVNENNPIDEDYSFTPRLYEGETVDSRMYEQMTDMLDAAVSDGCNMWIASSYRDRETQVKILENAVQNRMMDYGMTRDEATLDALETIAKPGCSEHQTGLAVDFNYVNMDFEDTKEYRWLKENAADYGFVQRYPRDKEEITGISVEPWHYRYVGVEHARAMNENNLCLEEYISYLKNE